MILLAASAAFIGFFHSLAPGHWLPVVILAKTRKFPVQRLLAGAAVAASGHVLISVLFGALSVVVGAHLLKDMEERIEQFASLALSVFGLGYAIIAYFRHSRCHGHGHHGPDPRKKGKAAPFLFLFSTGLSPCLAVLPVLATSSLQGAASTAVAVLAFSGGVFTAVMGASWLGFRGVARLDHPFLEHYGDVITGLSVMAIGIVFALFPDAFHS